MHSCLAQPLRGSTTTKRASDPTTRHNRLHTHTHSPRRLAHPRSPMPPLSTLTARAAHTPLLRPAALASVPYAIMLARVRVRAPSRGHQASPQSGLGVGCKHCSRSKKLRGLSARAQARRCSKGLREGRNLTKRARNLKHAQWEDGYNMNNKIKREAGGLGEFLLCPRQS